jgi:hypothetical protein
MSYVEKHGEEEHLVGGVEKLPGPECQRAPRGHEEDAEVGHGGHLLWKQEQIFAS